MLNKETSNTPLSEVEGLSLSQSEAITSLASATSELARAVSKISYTPTRWVDNSEPDINAANLNKIEQGILQATTAINGAVDAINAINGNLHKVTYKKNFGGFSANSMREFLIAVINKVLENNLWTSSEDVIVFCATWFGHSYGMGILASQNGNNDIIISYDSEDGNSYTMHYVPSTNTVKTFYKRQGTSLL